MRPGARTIVRSASLLAVLAVVAVLSSCGDAPSELSRNVANADRSPRVRPVGLRAYLSAWEASWRRWAHDLEGGDEGALGYSSTPDASWERARRYYGAAATAYRHSERRLVALAPPPAMRQAHDAYLAAVRRQAARFEALAHAFGGTDPQALERALAALQSSQLKFDLDGARWERAVIAACNAARAEVPEFVRHELISNGQRTRGK